VAKNNKADDLISVEHALDNDDYGSSKKLVEKSRRVSQIKPRN